MLSVRCSGHHMTNTQYVAVCVVAHQITNACVTAQVLSKHEPATRMYIARFGKESLRANTWRFLSCGMCFVRNSSALTSSTFGVCCSVFCSVCCSTQRCLCRETTLELVSRTFDYIVTHCNSLYRTATRRKTVRYLPRRCR